MEKQKQRKSGGGGGEEAEDERMELPPGFRFHPTDEELVTHYLSQKVLDGSFVCRAIGEVDLNKCEPWDLPWRAKMGEKEWYFFCVRDRKYPTGLRTNRATESGYWKATGKDKEIHRGKFLVGMKKTLVFYRGRAPKGEKSNWVMHEYRMEGKSFSSFHNRTAKNEWVICRVFKKSTSTCVKRDDMGLSLPHLPPLLDPTLVGLAPVPAAAGELAHVSCFSNAMEGYPYHNCSTFHHHHNHNHPSLDVISKIAFSNAQLFAAAGGGSGGVCKAEREMLSLSQETGLTSDVNPEISSVFASNHEMGRPRFDSGAGDVVPSATIDDSCLWNY